jgi:hypothetical protein
LLSFALSCSVLHPVTVDFGRQRRPDRYDAIVAYLVSVKGKK